VDDLVIVEIKSLDELAVYVTLKEYNDIEGMIGLTELSRTRIRSFQKLIKIGRLEVATVMKVDKKKGYIDLSKKRVSEEEINKCEEKFSKSKAVHSIIRRVSQLLHKDPEELYKQVGWPLYKKYEHEYNAFKIAVVSPEPVFEALNIDVLVKETFTNTIHHHLAPLPVRVRIDVEVTCFDYEGVDAIKIALQKGEDTSNKDTQITIKLISPPVYAILTTAPQKNVGVTAVENAVEAIEREITSRNGNLNRKTDAYVDNANRQTSDEPSQSQRKNEGVWL